MGEETLVAMPIAPHHHHVHLPAHLASPPDQTAAKCRFEDPADVVVQPPTPHVRTAVADAGEEKDVYYARKMMQGVMLRPPAHLPQPEAPPGLSRAVSSPAPNGHEEEQGRHFDRSASANSAAVVDVASIGRFFRDRRDVLSSAINRRILSLKETSPTDDDMCYGVQEIYLPNVKVPVRLKEAIAADTEEDDGYSFSGSHIKGRVSFFSRSGCRDCAAMWAFFRQSCLPYVEINLDVFPEREADLASRAGAAARVPQIFLNEKLLRNIGLVVLNSLRNIGEFERRVRELAGRRCPDAAPRVPVYGFDVETGKEEEKEDAMIGIVRVLRHRLAIQDRLVRVKLVKNCFSGADMVDGIVNHLECSRKKAVEIGKELARKHFIHHVFRENDFEDGAQNLYRFLEHDPAVPKYYNFRGSTNDGEPKPAVEVGQRMTKIMVAILEAYASDDRRRIQYGRVAASEEFRRYANLARDLQRVDVFAVPAGERLPFFLNLHNAMAIHAVIKNGQPAGVVDRRSFFTDFQYVVGGYPYSLTTIKNGILRSNRMQPYTIVKSFGSADKRLEVNPLVHFALCNATRSSPIVRFYSTQGVEPELRHAAREFLLDGGVEIDIETRTVHLTRTIKWYSTDFGQDRDILRWILNYLDPTKAGLLTHLLNDGGPISIAYQDYGPLLFSFWESFLRKLPSPSFFQKLIFKIYLDFQISLFNTSLEAKTNLGV